MSDIMTCMPFGQLMDWVLQEKKGQDTVFGVHRPYTADPKNDMTIFTRNLETPVGPAAGPHTQLAQNIIASYYAGARFFELKTVQKMDGAELSACVNKPCILADDEGYNCEWSTELTVPDAMGEYIKAWFILHVIAKEFGLGAQDGFQFNISVGYDLAGIKGDKVNTFIDGMMEAKDTVIFQECRKWLLDNADKFQNFTREDIEAIPSNVCNSATISTLHGCPPQEIESIANYLLTEKHLNTFVKCNPTLLGYDFARKTMDEMGYDYMVFGDFHFRDDLQYEDAVPMLTRLMKLSEGLGLEFGVKITNTFPVDVTRNELPSEEMYMSGKALFPLSISLAAKLSAEFAGKLRISYSGGADYYNIDKIVGCGIWPVTMATTLLKTGGYQRFTQVVDKVEGICPKKWEGIDVDALKKLAADAITDGHHVKNIKPVPNRKSTKEVPLLDCFYAPCSEGCPIHQDIPQYVALTGEGKYKEALEVILEKNALPFITGTLCAHNCMTKCTRNFYEESVNIRGTKLTAAEHGYEQLIGEIKAGEPNGKKVAVVGGGPAGIAAAYFLAREGAAVTIFEKEEKAGGVIRYVIPGFRIGDAAIDKDISFIQKMGVEICTNTEITSVADLKAQGYDAVILAIGAGKPGTLKLEKGETVNALKFLRDFKANDGKLNIGKNVVVIGGGNTAMDTARAAKRTEGVEHVYLVYRRTKRYMPAAEDELLEVLKEGVEFKELLSPVSLDGGRLLCKKMKLGQMDASGRAGVTETADVVEVPADTVIVAVGEKIDTDFYTANQIAVDERGKAKVNDKTLETSVSGVYVAGDGARGAATIVEGIRDAQLAVKDILGKEITRDAAVTGDVKDCFEKKGILKHSKEAKTEEERCLTCNKVCENCVDVCPNRANISIKVPGMAMNQVIHVDYMCNECGNCKSFCPYASAPYKDKFTLFANEKDMADSKNDGFVVLDKENKTCKVRFVGLITDCKADDPADKLYDGLKKLICAVIDDYGYLITK
ncbi:MULTISPECIES: putative selenate reductase subunit YgfK [unclassified Ruminococcus]|uniref:putative selenate reductase subunit YgfK n=1 Tax=unclassified Ruminococcus TaxID=2608920 RepID=UPI001898DECB|nr:MULTISPECIES: putative selenate reductase subunit YgfK [unclassified Ruminococcus]MDB8779592.1 putative selenate reductase subunit YgfK [Ruminococcus sp. 1001136sp1]MDB8787171.1 putative selenate reductase subunit YgfK [Ruminococcus sp. 1001136sp1]